MIIDSGQNCHILTSIIAQLLISCPWQPELCRQVAMRCRLGRLIELGVVVLYYCRCVPDPLLHVPGPVRDPALLHGAISRPIRQPQPYVDVENLPPFQR